MVRRVVPKARRAKGTVPVKATARATANGGPTDRVTAIRVRKVDLAMAKGRAVKAGFEVAAQHGCTHVFQVDADGQHDLGRMPEFLRAAAERPEALVLGYPVYDETYAANVAAMRFELEEKHPTLHLVGRNGMHRYNNQDHAMMTAMLTVENILAGERRYDTWCVNEDAEYHEAGDEGAEKALPQRETTPVSDDQAAALASVREVPERIKPGRKAA